MVAQVAHGQQVQIPPETWVGGSIDVRTMASDTAGDGVVAIPYIAFGGRREGWGPTIGLGWFRSNITRDLFGPTEEAGNLRVRPWLVGVSYTKNRGRLSYEGSVLTGVAVNHFGLSQETEQALRDRHLEVVAEASNSVAYRVGTSVWYFITPRVAFRVHGNYLITRSRVTVGRGTGAQQFRQPADAFTVGAGLAYRVF